MTVHFTPQSTSSPGLTISGPSEMTTQSSAIFNIDLVLKNYVTEFYVDVVAPEHSAGNPIMKICEFQLTGKGNLWLTDVKTFRRVA